jgi:RNA polymerase-binding transcription factor DksA
MDLQQHAWQPGSKNFGNANGYNVIFSSAGIESGVGKDKEGIMSLLTANRAKQSLLKELDANFQKHFHVTLSEVINDLRLHYGEITVDPSLDEVFVVIDRTKLLNFVASPSIYELRDSIHRISAGTFGICVACKHSIATDILESTPNATLCPSCSQRVAPSGLA